MTLRERLRTAVGPCAPDVDPDAVVDAVASEVLRARAGRSLAEDMYDRAAGLASRNGARRLVTKGV